MLIIDIKPIECNSNDIEWFPVSPPGFEVAVGSLFPKC